MNGQMKKYKDSLNTMQGPILLSQCQDIKLYLRGLMKYAKEKGVKVIDLSEDEKSYFIQKQLSIFVLYYIGRLKQMEKTYGNIYDREVRELPGGIILI